MAGLFLPLLQNLVSLFDEPFEFFILPRDAIGIALFVARARIGRRLFDQLPDIVAGNSDAVFQFGERKRAAVAHDDILRSGLFT